MRVLVYNDLHLKPAGSDYDVSALAVPEDVDTVWIAGDLTHREGEDDVALAARFVEQFPSDIPVLYVPGNHDPAPMPDRVVDGVERAVSGHNVVRGYGSVTVVGWGCEKRSLDPPLDQGAFPALDPRTAPRDERGMRQTRPPTPSKRRSMTS
jgi:Icc-related predicted phosphoesterase